MVPQIVPIVCFQEVYCGSKPGIFKSTARKREFYSFTMTYQLIFHLFTCLVLRFKANAILFPQEIWSSSTVH